MGRNGLGFHISYPMAKEKLQRAKMIYANRGCRYFFLSDTQFFEFSGCTGVACHYFVGQLVKYYLLTSLRLCS